MKLNKQQKNKGFTIIEAMIAIFILTVSVASMLGITASSAASARYANNEITANYLLQEAVDSIRNSRDTIAFQMTDGDDSTNLEWDNFLKKYGYPNGNCFSTNGCDISIEDFDPTAIDGRDIISCNNDGGVCENLNYDNNMTKVFYNHSGHGDMSEFRRTIKMKMINIDELETTVVMEWSNGDGTIPRTQKLVSYLLNWQK
ncbi:prepilin-type N-terminal cleavage/methylation domain-containing protein [Candidatus Nomurabacteria bacterium]|nr:prepilin-type N-terminal cleavage/methylation domain-containing protein [Candidatus Nomurabacteria bacterium]